jgi:hypothetical protein
MLVETTLARVSLNRRTRTPHEQQIVVFAACLPCMDQILTPEITGWLSANPWAANVAVAFAVVVILRLLWLHRPITRDPQRLFRPAQKNEAGVRCGNSRCEHKNPLWFRCPSTGTHGDHIYPHSRGGWTTQSNLQLLCPTHNLRKSAKIPSRLYIWRLQQRRKTYYPTGVTGKVEWKKGRAY